MNTHPLFVILLLVLHVPSCRRDDDQTKPGGVKQSAPPQRPQSPTTKPATMATPTKTQATPSVALQTDDEARPKFQRLMPQRKTVQFEGASKEFGEMLEAIRCVGRPLLEIKSQLGKPDAEDLKSISYRFEAGYGGWDWVIEHDGAKVVSVTRRGVN